MKMKKDKLENSSHVFTYLSFELNNELFAANVKNVINILEMREITQVPKSPSYFKGVIDLRGNALPIIDLRIIFGLDNLEYSSDTCILVLQVKFEGEEMILGAIVDRVREVLEINQASIEPAPGIGNRYHPDFINGMWKKNENFIMLLDLDKVLNMQEIISVNEVN